MGENQIPNRKIVQRPGGFFQDFVNRFRLIGRLMMDSRVNPFLKILPVGTLIYVFSPVDLISLNPMDDAFLIWAGTTLFVELCPPHVVEEHMGDLKRIINGQWNTTATPQQAVDQQEEIIEGEFIETDEGGQRQDTKH